MTQDTSPVNPDPTVDSNIDADIDTDSPGSVDALAARQIWISVLSKASGDDLEACLASLGSLPDYRYLRSPETGLAMVRARAGGDGQVFNLGEMTVTRCVVQINAGMGADSGGDPLPITGFGYVAGRSHRHANQAALCDALLQHPDWCDRVHTQVIEPLQAIAQSQTEQLNRQTEATRVNFFTMLRGES